MSDTAGSRNDGVVDQLLLESGIDDGELRHALLDLRALAAEAPAPSAGIAALMAGASTTAGPTVTTVLPAAEPTTTSMLPGKPVDELAARRKAKRRITLTTLSLAASLAAGGAVAAASDQGFRDSLSQLNQAVSSFVTGSAPAPAGNQGAYVPAPGPAATRPAPTGPEAVPAAPATTPAPGVVASSSATPRPGSTPTHGPSASPAEKPVPAEPSLPTDVPGDVRKGIGQAPKLPVPVPVPTEVPLPGKTPDVPLK